MEDILKDNKFEAVKYRHEDQAKLLIYLSSRDLDLLKSFFALQLAFGGFLSQFNIEDVYSKIGLFLIDTAITVSCLMVLKSTEKYRQNVAKTIINCNEALGYDKEGIYLTEKSLNHKHKFDSFYKWYLIVVIASLVGVFSILFLSNNNTTIDKKNSINIKCISCKDSLTESSKKKVVMEIKDSIKIEK